MPTPKPKEHNPEAITEGMEERVAKAWEEKSLQENFLNWLEDNPTAFREQSPPSLIGLFTKELLDPDPGHTGVGGVAMKLGEVAKANKVERLYREYEDVINNSAKVNGIDANLLRAIIREETSHKLPGEDLIGDSVGPCQIRVSLWGKRYGLSKEQLKDEATNIEIAARILGEEQTRLKEQGYAVTPEMLASRYNSGSTTEITDYGIRVREFYNSMK